MAIKQILLKLLDDDVDMVKWLNRQDNRSETIRLAIRLLMELDSGVTDLLFELFPDLAADLDAPPPDDGNKDILERIARAVEKLSDSDSIQLPTLHMVEEPLPPTTYHMSSPRPPEVTSTAPAFSGTKPISTTNGKSDGSAADNLLDSLNNF